MSLSGQNQIRWHVQSNKGAGMSGKMAWNKLHNNYRSRGSYTMAGIYLSVSKISCNAMNGLMKRENEKNVDIGTDNEIRITIWI